jgi:hypothetical protein
MVFYFIALVDPEIDKTPNYFGTLDKSVLPSARALGRKVGPPISASAGMGDGVTSGEVSTGTFDICSKRAFSCSGRAWSGLPQATRVSAARVMARTDIFIVQFPW